MNTNSYLRTAVLTGLFAVPFIPLVISPSLFFPFISGKGFTFRILVEIIAALWIILALRDAEYRPRMSHVLSAASLFIGVIFLADVFGVAPGKSLWSNFERMEGFVALIHHFLYFLVASSVLIGERVWSRFFHVSIGVSLFLSLYSVLQLAGELVINQGGVRVDATFGNAAYLAAYLLIHTFILLFFFSRDRLSRAGDILVSVGVGSATFLTYYAAHVARQGAASVGNMGGALVVLSLVLLIGAVSLYATSRRAIWYSRYVEPALYLSLVGFGVIILVYTATRGAILALVGGLLLTALLIALFERENKAARKLGIGALVGVLAVVGLFFAVRDTDFIRNSPSLARIASINLSEGTPRFTIWSLAWTGFLDRPILGYGQENFNYVFNEHYHPKMYAQEQWFDRAHDIFFDWLVAGGALGILSYLSMFAAALWLIWKRETKFRWLSSLMNKLHLAPDNGFSVTERALLTGLLAAYFFQNIFVFDNIGTYILFFTLLAYIHSLHSVPLSDTWQERISFRTEFVDRVLAPIVIVVFVVVVYFVNIRPIQAGLTLIEALQAQGQGNFPAVVEKYQKIFALDTFANAEAREQIVQSAIYAANDPNVDVTTKQSLIALAKQEMEKQLALTPDDARYVLFMGYLLNRTRQSAESLPYLERAVELSPKKQTMYFELGSAYLSAGLNEKAYEAFKTAYDFDRRFTEAALFNAIGALYAGKKDEAVALLTEKYGSPMVPDDRIIKAYFDTHQFDLLLPLLESRVEQEPGNVQFRINLAAAYLEANQQSKAIGQLTAIQNLPGDDAQLKQIKEMVGQWITEIRAGRRPQ